GTHTRLEIQHFFEVYKDLEPGKSVEGAHWAGREEAEQVVVEALERAKAAGLTTARWRMPSHDAQTQAEEVEAWSESHAEAAERARGELATKDNPLSD
ncbi:MAG: inorganic diphosphatase, partial [Actinomycetia bacterium]|nr:inorganic diphosphatase [Actinomycetes bacterium]